MLPSLWYACWLAVLAAINTFVPVHAAPVTTSTSVTLLPQSQIASYKPSTYYASAGYCNPSTTLSWTCGANCDANMGFMPIASGGDGFDVQFWYVGYDPSLQTIVVAHQGTEPKDILPLFIDAEVALDPLDPTLFPGLDSSIEAHHGFLDAHALSAKPVLQAVQTGIQTHNTTNILLTGHSLGAAISLLHTIYLPAQMPTTDLNITYIGYGLPRVGNQAFADYIDAHTAIASMTHITNKKDPIPIVPGIRLGYHHPAGEIHINPSESWYACPGQDNPNVSCAVGTVPNILPVFSDLNDHDGPYNGVTMGCDAWN